MTARSTSQVVAGFTHDVHAVRVVFGLDAHRTSLLPELEALGAKTILVLASASQKAVAGELTASVPGGRAQSWEFTRSRSVAEQVSRAHAHAVREQIDCLVAVGSGAAIHTARETALRGGLPLVALPTSYAGAEFVSPPDAAADHREKTRPAKRSSLADPRTVIYDPTLTVRLPDHITGRSALRALAHGVDILCTPGASPVAVMMAEEGIRELADGAPDTILHPYGMVGRSRTQYGSYLTAAALAVTAPGPHRTLTEVVEQACGLRHTDVHIVLLPYLLAETGTKRPQDLARVAAALGCNDAVQGVIDLARDIGAPQSLRDLGMTPAELDAAIKAVRHAETPASDTQLDPEALAALVGDSYHGKGRTGL
ncbi:iron-containing alcohol dehydrogenase [Streptomyces malaysiensis]|uniref:iron-containing alcohol dehydrogenase n=1 Tax=Streptomyces malaysiensis TaxID=92644 RepID=UPI0008537316|nr:iron-containing alcohol dehydrogenase [Streptomyces sp. SPMA113]